MGRLKHINKSKNVMETKVFERLKPKAASYGFNDDELKTAAKYIVGSLTPEATDEMVDKAIDQFAPILSLSQSASQRSFSRLKTQFEKEHTNNLTKPTDPPQPKNLEPPKQEDKPKDDVPEWFKKYQEQSDKERKSLEAKLAQFEKEKANEDFRSKAIKGLKDVDENYYSLMLKGREFDCEDAVNSFVSDVTDGWNKLVQARGIQLQKEVTPPSGGGAGEEKPSQAVLDRIAAKGDTSVQSPIRGLSKPQ